MITQNGQLNGQLCLRILGSPTLGEFTLLQMTIHGSCNIFRILPSFKKIMQVYDNLISWIFFN